MIADDHTIFRRGLTEILADHEGLKVVGEANDGNEAVAKAHALKPDIVLMDLNMPNCNGVEATSRLQREMPEVNILVLTVSDKEDDLFAAIKAGAKGYLLKQEEPEQLLQAVLQVARGGVVVSAPMASYMLDQLRAKAPGAPPQEEASLSHREQEVLQLVAQGTSNKEIADTLVISENTVKTHLRNILDKLHLVNRSQAAAYAARAGLIRGGKGPGP